MLLDEIIPEYDVASRHRTVIAASPPTVYRVARNADLGRGWVVRLLMGARMAPGLAVAALGGHRLAVRAARFTLMDERPGEEFVLGIMGRFWRLTGNVVPATAEQLRQLPEPGLAQGFWNFRVDPHGEGTMLSTETRVRCGDDASRTRFLSYWRVIRPASGMIRKSMLRQLRRSAETQSADPAAQI